MSGMKQALLEVGYRPQTTTPVAGLRVVNRVVDRVTGLINFDVQRAGTHYRVRYRGRTTSAFGLTVEEAKKRLCVLDEGR
jgi:hypothetical protein